MTMTSEAGGGQHGLSLDDYGHRFACNNSDHIRFYIYDDRYASRNPFYAMPACIQSIAVDGPAAEVYRISPEEPWRVIRTKWRVAGLVGGPMEGGGVRRAISQERQARPFIAGTLFRRSI